MALWALTSERVSLLQAQRAKKEQELNALLQLTSKDLWNTDLDALSAAWQDVLQGDILAAQTNKGDKKKGATSKFAKVSRKRVSDAADGEYTVKAKVAKTKANSSPKNPKPTAPKLTKEMHTAAFTSVNKAGPSSLAITKKEEISKVTPILSIDDDDEFEALIKGIRPTEKPVTIDLVSPQTAMKPKKTFTIPGIKKPSAMVAPKPRVVSKSKAPKRNVESDDEDDSFAFMVDDRQPSVQAEAGARRPPRAAATKAKAIVLTSDDVYDEEDDFEEEEEEDDE
jgi:hypothetical protein